MNKKMISVIAIIIVLCVVGVVGFFVFRNSELENKNGSNTSRTEKASNKDDSDKGDVDIMNGKVLVVYYSATNNTKGVAEKLANHLNASLFEIVPEKNIHQMI